MSESDQTTRVIRRKTVDVPAETDPDKTVRPAKGKSGPPPLPTAAKPETVEEDDDKTRVYRKPDADKPEASQDAASPTVGWVIIMAGPGRGTSLTLGFGMNHIGRSAANRVILDFGDEEISRKTHTTLTYDPRGKKFYIQPGPDATNLTYVGEDPKLQPILTPTEIFGGETIVLGKTKLKFVAFCGPDFSWD